MIEFKTLLPPNATKTEQMLERALAYDLPLWTLSASLHQLRSKRPDTYSRWLAGEWGIAAFSRFFTDESDFFAAMITWLQCRGTSAATTSALELVGVDHAQLDVENFRLHVHLPKPWYGPLGDFKFAVNESIPLHLQFYRITSGCDMRHGEYDNSEYDGCLYDDDSGVWQDGIKINFCTKRTFKFYPWKIRARLGITGVYSGNLSRTWQSVATWTDTQWTTDFHETQSDCFAAKLPINMLVRATKTAKTAAVTQLTVSPIDTHEHTLSLSASLTVGGLSGQIKTSGPTASRSWNNVSAWGNERWELYLPTVGTVII